MPVDLKTLIKAAPFKEETRQKLLAGLATMTEGQKFALSQTCWQSIAMLYFSKLKFKRDKLLLEIQEGKKKFDNKEFEDMENEIAQQYADKLSSAHSEATIEEVRKELKKYLRPSKPVRFGN